MTAHAFPVGPTCRACKTSEARCAFAQGCCEACSHAFDGGNRRPLPREHGTEASYQRHRYLREPACEACRAAHSRHVAERRERPVPEAGGVMTPDKAAYPPCQHVEHTTGFTGKRLGRFEEFGAWQPCGWSPHHEHQVGYGDYADVECCICPGSPCGAVTVPDVLDHRVYDEASAERRGVFLARQQISDKIAKAAPRDNPDHYDDDAYVAATESFRRCWDIARGDIDEPPF